MSEKCVESIREKIVFEKPSKESASPFLGNGTSIPQGFSAAARLRLVVRRVPDLDADVRLSPRRVPATESSAELHFGRSFDRILTDPAAAVRATPWLRCRVINKNGERTR